jgi:hypothetical protein
MRSQYNTQPENLENRNGSDLVQAFPKKWWVESDFMAPNLLLPLQLKGSGCHYKIYILSSFCSKRTSLSIEGFTFYEMLLWEIHYRKTNRWRYIYTFRYLNCYINKNFPFCSGYCGWTQPVSEGFFLLLSDCNKILCYMMVRTCY